MLTKPEVTPVFFCGAMNRVWQELGVALCLVLVIEGILPFLYPQRWKELVVLAADVDDRTKRIVGFASMILGTGLLYLIRG